MNKTTLTVLAAVVLAMPASAQPARTDRDAILDPRIANGRVAGFDLAGIRLGMTPEQAITQGSQAGFRHLRTSNGASFAARRLAGLRARRPNYVGSNAGKVVREQYFKGPQGDNMLVAYAAMPEGPRVEKIQYFFDPKKIDRKDLERTMFKKFGSPNGRATMVGDSKWCDYQCRGREAGAGYSNSPSNIVRIDGSVPAQDFISALINADLERLAPKGRSGI